LVRLQTPIRVPRRFDRPWRLSTPNIAASFAAMVWLIVDWRVSKKRNPWLAHRRVAGLATITPAAGYVSRHGCHHRIGSPASFAIRLRTKNKFGWDDALDVWGVHGVGGLLGIILLGFRVTEWTRSPNGRRQRISGRRLQLLWQATCRRLFSSVWALIFTLGMLWIITASLRAVEDAHEELGLDEAIHGETAYVEVCNRGAAAPERPGGLNIRTNQ